MVASPKNFSLLAELLAEQQRLQTPVARFASAYDGGSGTQLAALKSQLIPLSTPKPGEQYAFEVDLDACTGCKACVSACHSLNGLDDQETWRDVGLIVGGDYRHPVQQTVTTACHHCADPACLNGCPVLAYEKDPVTGIVRHLDDQCIGCQYCVLKCPYDVPKYNARLGIVRKCDLCHGRLAEGEAPACVQACPTQAIRIVTVKVPGKERAPGALHDGPLSGGLTSSARSNGAFLAAAPAADYTRPTTRYVSQRGLPASMVAADIAMLRPQPAHWPLVIMLTLLPLAIGAQLLALALAELSSVETRRLVLLSVIAGGIGLAASVAHLGKPLRAWRIFLGWRTSWLSREAMVFGAWFPLTLGSLLNPSWLPLAGACGAAGLVCSTMIYADTRRTLWRLAQTVPRFFGSAALLGAAGALALGIAPAMGAIVVAIATLGKLACDARLLRPLDDTDEETVPTPTIATARLLVGPLRIVFGLRIVVALFSGLSLTALTLAGQLSSSGTLLLCTLVLLADVMERYLFFRSVDAPKMPGLPSVAGGRHA